ncbi:MAG TPA: DUF1488 family protein [Gammaproteobacteria bacterium]|nr:DUF1488 family protein [Gammaproteobacteria bacterium]
MNSEIEVHTDERSLLPGQEGVTFNAYVDGHKVECVITGIALKSQFKDPDKPIMEIFADNQDVIGSMATFLISARPERVDGAVVIRAEDLKDFLTV